MAQRILKANAWIIFCIRQSDSEEPFYSFQQFNGDKKCSSHFKHSMKLNSWFNSSASHWRALKLCMCVNIYDEFQDPWIFCFSKIDFFSIFASAAIYCYCTFSRIRDVIHCVRVVTYSLRPCTIIRYTIIGSNVF